MGRGWCQGPGTYDSVYNGEHLTRASPRNSSCSLPLTSGRRGKLWTPAAVATGPAGEMHGRPPVSTNPQSNPGQLAFTSYFGEHARPAAPQSRSQTRSSVWLHFTRARARRVVGPPLFRFVERLSAIGDSFGVGCWAQRAAVRVAVATNLMIVLRHADDQSAHDGLPAGLPCPIHVSPYVRAPAERGAGHRRAQCLDPTMIYVGACAPSSAELALAAAARSWSPSQPTFTFASRARRGCALHPPCPRAC